MVAMLLAPLHGAPGDEHLLVVYIKDGVRTTILARNVTPSKRSARWITISPTLGDEFDIHDICHVETIPVGAVTTMSNIRTGEDAEKARSHLERANMCWRAHPSAREHLRGYISELESDIKRFGDGQRKVNGAWLGGADYARMYRPELGTNASDSVSFDTRDGRQFRDVQITRVEATGVVVQHQDGVTKIPFDALSDETRAKLDPRFTSGARGPEPLEDPPGVAPSKGYATRAPEGKRGVPADGPEGMGSYTVMQTVSGAIYHDVVVVRASTNGVVINHSTGSHRLEISDLPDTVLSDMRLPSQADQMKARREIHAAERGQREKGLVPYAGEWISPSELKARLEKIEREKFARMRSDLDYVRPLIEFKRFLPKEVTMVSEERVRAGNALGETLGVGTRVVVLGLDGDDLVVPCKRTSVAMGSYTLSGNPFNLRRDVDRSYTARVEEGVGRVRIESTDLAARVIGRLNHPPSVVATEETRVAFSGGGEDTAKWPIEAGRVLTVVGFGKDSDEATVLVNGKQGRIKIAHTNWDQAAAEMKRRSTDGRRSDAGLADERHEQDAAASAAAAEGLEPAMDLAAIEKAWAEKPGGTAVATGEVTIGDVGAKDSVQDRPAPMAEPAEVAEVAPMPADQSGGGGTASHVGVRSVQQPFAIMASAEGSIPVPGPKSNLTDVVAGTEREESVDRRRAEAAGGGAVGMAQGSDENWVSGLTAWLGRVVAIPRDLGFNTGEGGGSPPAGFVLIPAGEFQMGDSFAEGDPNELPVHGVYVSAFYMQSTEVTKAQWDEVRGWGSTRGYTDLAAGDGKAPNHPVQTVSWYDVVKWCNARSEKEGLSPCYYTTSAKTTVYRTGSVNVANDAVDWNANGYRLPTEAEWEKAARGGSSGHRFPWSDADTITHSRANYYSTNSVPYDVSPTRGHHPDFDDGGFPYTSPVGFFAPNGCGLHDMAGNVWEWCGDWYSSNYYGSSPPSDPTGPISGSDRVLRGGDWNLIAHFCRVAYRTSFNPDLSGLYPDYFGFRPVRR